MKTASFLTVLLCTLTTSAMLLSPARVLRAAEGDKEKKAPCCEATVEAGKKCAHESCSCTAPDGEKYCSAACEAAKDITQLACQCGHSGCSGAAVVR